MFNLAVCLLNQCWYTNYYYGWANKLCFVRYRVQSHLFLLFLFVFFFFSSLSLSLSLRCVATTLSLDCICSRPLALVILYFYLSFDTFTRLFLIIYLTLLYSLVVGLPIPHTYTTTKWPSPTSGCSLWPSFSPSRLQSLRPSLQIFTIMPDLLYLAGRSSIAPR